MILDTIKELHKTIEVHQVGGFEEPPTSLQRVEVPCNGCLGSFRAVLDHVLPLVDKGSVGLQHEQVRGALPVEGHKRQRPCYSDH